MKVRVLPPVPARIYVELVDSGLTPISAELRVKEANDLIAMLSRAVVEAQG
jgi:hypothetical protein